MNIFDTLIVSSPNQEFKLREEYEDDYVEYKLRLDTKNSLGINKLISQMNYRLDIGKNLLKKREAHYVLGISDNGTLGGLNEDEIDKTFAIFSKVVNDCGATIVHIEKKVYKKSDEDSYVIYAIIQKIESFKINELNVVFVGPSQHGKTTTISHIVYGQKDDGKGYARNLIFKHEHEKISGITSSIKKEIIGMCKGLLVNYNLETSNGWEDIVNMSEKIINLIDLPGNLQYSKSTFFGLSTYNIDGIVIVIDQLKIKNNENILNEIKFYESFAIKFNIPYVIVNIDSNISSNSNVNANSNLPAETQTFQKNTIELSNITGKGINNLIDFLNSLEKNQNVQYNKISIENESESLFCVSETYCVPDIGIIFSGIMKIGSLSIGNHVFITNGNTYHKATIKSIQRKQINSKTLYLGESGAIQVEFNTVNIPVISKHMMMTTTQYEKYSFFCFEILNENYIKNIMQIFFINKKCSMFVDNFVVATTIIKIDYVKNQISLQSSLPIIVPSINAIKCLAFLKCDRVITFGKLTIDQQ